MIRLCLALLLCASSSSFASAPPEVGGEPAWAGGKAAPDPALRDPAYPQASVARTRLAPLAPARIDAVRQANSRPGNKLLTIGLERAVADEAVAHATELDWRASPGGGLSARLELTSPGAVALRTALEIDGLPADASLRFLGADDGALAGIAVDGVEVARQLQVQPRYWTPVTEGETQGIEVHLPAGIDPRWTRVRLVAASHLFVSPQGSLAGAKIGESDTCEFDAKCVSNPSTAYTNAKNAVARMVFQTPQGSSLCTGTLLNDTDTSTQVPYFFGAAHCFTTQSVASTLTTFWFYEATGCGTGVLDASAQQVSGGATVLFASTASDVLFLRLNANPPGGAHYLGWNSGALAAGNAILALHHPAGDVKKVSLGNVTGFGGSSLASGQFTKVGYTDGTTEGGSSGCALLTFNGSEYQLRGGLLGGTAGCANTGSLTNPDNSDDFSRFDQAFASLQQFLQPSTTPPPSNIDYTGAWNNSSQSGWGLVVIRGSSGIYAMYIYHYDQDSSPGWYLSAGALSGSSYNAGVLAFTGPWFGINPFNPAAVGNRNAGNLQVTFTSATTATINFTIDGRNVSTTLNKLAF
jgi:lysyl endopeptidase